MASSNYIIICLAILIQLCVSDIAPCDDYYVLLQEVDKRHKLLSMDSTDFTWDDITKASNNTIREECALHLECTEFVGNCQRKLLPKNFAIDEKIAGKAEGENYATGNGKDITEPTETTQDILIDITTPIYDMDTAPSTMEINATYPVEDETTQYVPRVELNDNITEPTETIKNSTVSSNSTEQNEALKQAQSEKTKKNAAIIGCILAGSLGSAGVLYFIGYKIQGMLQSATYNIPA